MLYFYPGLSHMHDSIFMKKFSNTSSQLTRFNLDDLQGYQLPRLHHTGLQTREEEQIVRITILNSSVATPPCLHLLTFPPSSSLHCNIIFHFPLIPHVQYPSTPLFSPLPPPPLSPLTSPPLVSPLLLYPMSHLFPPSQLPLWLSFISSSLCFPLPLNCLPLFKLQHNTPPHQPKF